MDNIKENYNKLNIFLFEDELKSISMYNEDK